MLSRDVESRNARTNKQKKSSVQREQVKEPLAALAGAGTSQLEPSGPHGMEDKHSPPGTNSSRHRKTQRERLRH